MCGGIQGSSSLAKPPFVKEVLGSVPRSAVFYLPAGELLTKPQQRRPEIELLRPVSKNQAPLSTCQAGCGQRCSAQPQDSKELGAGWCGQGHGTCAMIWTSSCSSLCFPDSVLRHGDRAVASKCRDEKRWRLPPQQVGAGLQQPPPLLQKERLAGK